jgi:hypothetical protein
MIVRSGVSWLFFVNFFLINENRETEGYHRLMTVRERQEALTWSHLSTKEKALKWATDHQYSLIIGGWALGMGVAGAILARNPYQTTAQKVREAGSAYSYILSSIFIGRSGSCLGTRPYCWSNHWRGYFEPRQNGKEGGSFMDGCCTFHVPLHCTHF